MVKYHWLFNRAAAACDEDGICIFCDRADRGNCSCDLKAGPPGNVYWLAVDDGGNLLFSGVNLLFMGVIGEYIGRIFLGMSNNPQFVVRCVHEQGAEEKPLTQAELRLREKRYHIQRRK